MPGVELDRLRYVDDRDRLRPLLRAKPTPNTYLVTYVLESILRSNGIDFESFPLAKVWTEDGEPRLGVPTVVLLSTTFICNFPTLRWALGWVERRFPGVPIVLGGQFSNLKYGTILRDHRSVSCVVRGDGEEAIPLLLEAIGGERDLSAVPNLVYRRARGLEMTPLSYIDIDAYPAPDVPGPRAVIPYESMRGCPFSCRFCSYPAASPTWRYKSPRKIRGDWFGYAERNRVEHIQALDSTFTVPKPRLRELLPTLVGAPFTWEAYSRASALCDRSVVEALEAARCTKLSIGFESMSPNSLRYMHKQVRAEQNRRAHELLRQSAIRYRISYMVGYPGETPQDYALTHAFLCDEFEGHFMLSVFSFTDETMPVWEDAERFSLVIEDPDDRDSRWEHSGMDIETARELRAATVRSVRWRSETAVWLLWQARYQIPLVPGSGRREALRQEKLVERLAMLPVDVRGAEAQRAAAVGILDELGEHGVVLTDDQERPVRPDQLIGARA